MILGWRERSDRLKVVGYKDLEGFEEFNRGMVGPNVREVAFEVVDKLGWSVVRAVIPDAEYCGICSMRVGLYGGVWCKETIGRIDHEVKCKDDFLSVSGCHLK